MTVELETKFVGPQRVDMAGLVAHLTANHVWTKSVWQLADIFYGKQPVKLGDLFDVRVSGVQTDPWSPQVHWLGATELLDGLGTKLPAGRWFVDGSAGHRLGYRMSGGEIRVKGRAGNWLAGGCSGGQVLVNGDVGDFAAASLPGARDGCNGGQIVVLGNAGDWVGRRMRRGFVAVAGNCGKAAAWQMRAGTLLCGGSADGPVGVGIKRGTVILLAEASSDALPERCKAGRALRQPTWPMIRSQLEDLGYQSYLPESRQRFQILHAEPRFHQRGEYWLPLQEDATG